MGIHLGERDSIKAGEIVQLAQRPWLEQEYHLYHAQTFGRKGMVQRRDPGFHCYALVSREQVQQEETRSLIDKVYNGSRRLFWRRSSQGKN